MRLIRFSVNHPVTTCMLMLGLFMGGVYSISRMEVELLPSIAIPTLVVLTDVPRTSPERVHEEVTLPMEEVLNGVGNLITLNSVSLEGESRIILEFDWGSNVRTAEIEVREQVNALNLPENASRPIIKRYDPSSAPVFRFDILGGGLSAEELRGIAEEIIKPGLERLSGVGEVEIVGGTDPEYQVIGNRDKLSRYNLTVLSLVKCISEESVNRKGGSVEIEGGAAATLRISGKADSVFDLENLIVAILPSGNPLRVRDVARVVRTSKETDSYARIDGEPSVGLSIKKSSDVSVVTVAKRIRRELNLLAPSLESRSVSFQVSQDDSEYVVNAETLVLSSIFQGGALSSLLLLFFLRDFRVTLIVVMAIPVSTMSAAIFLHGFDISRNILTLGGMGLAIGMTLDSSIVLIESIYKQLGYGLSPREAAIRGGSEVAPGIFSSTMTTVAAFLPILFIPGLMQQIFKSLALAIIWTVVMSMVVGILFIPMISARILRQKSTAPSKSSFGRWITKVLGQFDDSLENTLSGALRFCLGSVPLKITILVALVGLSLFSLKFLPGRGFVPRGNIDELWIRFEPPVGATLDYVDGRMREVEALLQTSPYQSFVKSVSADVRSDEGKLYVRLFPNRKVNQRGPDGKVIEAFEPMRPPEWKSLSQCIGKIREGCDSIPDLAGNNYVSLVEKIRGGTSAPVVVKVFSQSTVANSSDAEELRKLQNHAEAKFLPVFETIPGAIYERVRRNETPKEILLSTRFQQESLAEKGLTTQQISDTVRASVYGVKAATVLEDGDETDVTVFLEDRNGEAGGDFTRESIESLRVRSVSTGMTYPVGDVAEVSDIPSEGSVVLERTNRKPTVNLESYYAPYDVTGETVGDVTDQMISALKGIPGFSESFGYQLKSEAKDTEDSFADAFLAFIISVILIYMIMCSQFEKFGDPLAIMITVPLATAGSVLMLNVTGEISSLGAVVGAVILCGVVVNNGIILVEHVNILRKRGVERDDAIIQGSIRKLRSILITSLTSILGMLPLVFGVGEGTELYRGVAAVIFGGLIVATPLTLIALPVFYSLLDELSELANSLGFRVAIVKDRLTANRV